MEKENSTATVRTHRVGAFTSGFCMVGFGVMLLVLVLAGVDVGMEATKIYWNTCT